MKKYSLKELLQIQDDIVFLEENGHWEKGIPKWAEDLAKEFNTFAGSASVLMFAYREIGTALRAEYERKRNS